MGDVNSIDHADAENERQDDHVRHVQLQSDQLHNAYCPDGPGQDRKQNEKNRTQVAEHEKQINDDRGHGIESALDIAFCHQPCGFEHMHCGAGDIGVHRPEVV